MAQEIERKFRLKDPSVLDGLKGERYMQAYLADGPLAIRVRVADDRAWLTIKGRQSAGVCDEWEYSIPREDALAMAARPGVFFLDKTRYRIEQAGWVFEVDQYHGGLTGLFSVEVELPDIKAAVRLPEWVGEELTGRDDWSNLSLAKNGWPRDGSS